MYPFLFALFSPLAFLAHNLGEVEPASVFRPAAASVALCAVALGLLYLLFRDWDRAALGATLVVVVVLSYGQVYDALKGFGVSGSIVVRHRYLLPAALLLITACLLAVKRLRHTTTWSRSLAVAGVVLLVSPVVQIAAFYAPLGWETLHGRLQAERCALTAPAEPPDVYLIILDAYERDDVLFDVRGYDNSAFIHQLEDLGFFVAHGSLSNYASTRLSLASALNSTYVQDFGNEFGASTNIVLELSRKIPDNRLRRELSCIGYETVAFETGVPWTEWSDADHYLRRPSLLEDRLTIVGPPSRPEAAYLNTTVARALLDALQRSAPDSGEGGLDFDRDHRDRIVFVLDQLGQVARLPSPKLVFVHIVSPHPPYVFGPGGQEVRIGTLETEPGGEGSAYTDQVAYLNQAVLTDLRKILQESAVRPIIVIMGDHGWSDRDEETRMSILNAYLLPEGVLPPYPTITPVNTFRFILDSYFGGTFGLLPDRSYYSTHNDRFSFRPVDNTWRP